MRHMTHGARSLVFAPLLLLAMSVVPADDAAEKSAPAAEEQGQKEQTKQDQAEKEKAEKEKAKKEADTKELSGMSILGNQEAPKSLVIVPWKSSVLGDTLGISPMLDDSRQPVDREVFMRALGYYQIRSETRHNGSASAGAGAAAAGSDTAQSATAARRRKS